MRRAFKRAVRITTSPGTEWDEVGKESPDQIRVLAYFILPLSSIPAVCWSIGLALSGEHHVPGLDAAGWFPPLVLAGLRTLAGCVISVGSLAFALYALAPMFVDNRDWPRAVQVAAYSSSPVFLASVVLVLPDMAFSLMIAGLHALYLLYGGVGKVLGAKPGESAEYTALAIMLFLVISTFAGAFGAGIGAL